MSDTARATNPRAKARKRSIAEVREKGFETTTKATAALVDEDKPLTDIQRQFVKHWASGESPSSAAGRCGLQAGYAYRLIYMPNVLKAYRAEKEQYELASGMTRKRVIDGFMEAVEMAKVMAEPSTMVAAWREVGKMCGYYEPVEVKHTINVQGKVLHEKMDKMSDAELLEIVQQRMEQMATDANSVKPAALLEGANDDDEPTGAETP